MNYGSVLGAATGATAGVGAAAVLPETGTGIVGIVISVSFALVVAIAISIRLSWRRGKNISE